MADEYSFCTERRSTAIVRDDVILAHTDCKEMDLCPIRAFFRRKAILFWQTCPKVKFAVSSYFYSTKKSLVSGWVRYFKKIALIGHTEQCTRHLVVSFTLVNAQCRARNSAAIFIFLVTHYLLCMEMTSSCLRLSSFFLGLDTIIT